jgi:hypothetical protein
MPFLLVYNFSSHFYSNKAWYEIYYMTLLITLIETCGSTL